VGCGRTINSLHPSVPPSMQNPFSLSSMDCGWIITHPPIKCTIHWKPIIIQLWVVDEPQTHPPTNAPSIENPFSLSSMDCGWIITRPPIKCTIHWKPIIIQLWVVDEPQTHPPTSAPSIENPLWLMCGFWMNPQHIHNWSYYPINPITPPHTIL
jgi:hypothetical protein